jgi:hypothetical protein
MQYLFAFLHCPPFDLYLPIFSKLSNNHRCRVGSSALYDTPHAPHNQKKKKKEKNTKIEKKKKKKKIFDESVALI